MARVETADEDFVDIDIALDAADGLLHVHERHVEIDVPVEDDRGHQASGTGHLGDFAHAADGEQHALDGFAVEPFHLRGRAAAGTHGDDDGGALQVRQQVDGEFLPGQPADQRDS